ncbi:hypothetical protein FOCC_FOCC014703 [Frankliniella occidentalis]|nr:hypothetical protein FOCC_FOCC014703 [Frankliniella occidentalis]
MSMYRVNAPGCDNQVTCRITDSSSSILWSLQPGGAEGQYGFPTSCPRERCHLVLLDNATEPHAEPYCVDKLAETDLSGQVVAQVMAGMACVQGAVFAGGTEMARLRASNDPAAPAAPVVPFRKCCAVHQSYDLASRECVDGRGAVVDDDDENAVSTTPAAWTLPPPADYGSQQQAVNALFRRVFHKNLSALVDMRVGPPDCERPPRRSEQDQVDDENNDQYEQTALLDVAVFDAFPWDEQLVDEHGVITLRPAALRGVGEDATWRLGPGEYCVDDAGSAGTLVVKVCLGKAAVAAYQVCQRFGCFRKCCPHHEYFMPVGGVHVCVPRPPDPDQPPLRPQVADPPAVNRSDEFAYVHRSAQDLVEEAYQRFVADQRPHQVTFSSVVHNVCPEFRFRLEDNGDVWFFDRMGMLYLPTWPEIETQQYCLDDSQELANTSVLVCLPDTDPTQVEENSRINIITIGLLVSCMFLALTLLTYCCLPALQNLHGKTLMCHVFSLLIAYLFLALTQLLTKTVIMEKEWICTIIGNCMLFMFLSAFSWLNVMCFDIWRTFGGMTSSRAVKRSSASRRFRWYCVYAWGLSSLITVICITVDQWPGNDKSVFRPQIGDGSCWFRTEPFEKGSR